MVKGKDSGGKADAIVVSNLRKVFPGSNGNPDKVACRQLTLGIRAGECFGLLGPNGAGKVSRLAGKCTNNFVLLYLLATALIVFLQRFFFHIDFRCMHVDHSRQAYGW